MARPSPRRAAPSMVLVWLLPLHGCDAHHLARLRWQLDTRPLHGRRNQGASIAMAKLHPAPATAASLCWNRLVYVLQGRCLAGEATCSSKECCIQRCSNVGSCNRARRSSNRLLGELQERVAIFC